MSKRKNRTKKNQQQKKERNWIAVAAHFRTGAGVHKTKKRYSRKAKHKLKKYKSD